VASLSWLPFEYLAAGAERRSTGKTAVSERKGILVDQALLRRQNGGLALLSYPPRTISDVYTKGTEMAVMTADEYLALPVIDGEHTELIDGEIVMNSPRPFHQEIITWLVIRIGSWCEAKPDRGHVCIEVDHRIDDQNVFAPDLWWRKTSPSSESGATFDGPPDLAIEVRSEKTWKYDIGSKFRTYEASGLPELWLIDTKQRSVLIFRRSSGSATFDVSVELHAEHRSLLTSTQLPGLELDVQTLFARPSA
jgi:Uma2 family endonuclease